MRNAFTLIELMIVIAIIAIIAAIAIPNLMENRLSASEAAAAASLRSGFFPAQTVFQSNSLMDFDGNGVGCYSNTVIGLAGSTATSPAFGGVPPKRFTLLPSVFNITPSTLPDRIGGVVNGTYVFKVQTVTDVNSEYLAEKLWVCYAAPDVPGDTGRRGFSISNLGSVMTTRQQVDYADQTLLKFSDYSTVGVQAYTNPYGYQADPTLNSGPPNTYCWLPYVR